MMQNHISIPATDMPASSAFYATLGLRKIVDNPPDYIRFLCPDLKSTLSLERVDGALEEQSIIVYFECEYLDEKVLELKEQGMKFESGPEDQPWGWREAYLKDPSGTYVCLYYAGSERIRPRK